MPTNIKCLNLLQWYQNYKLCQFCFVRNKALYLYISSISKSVVPDWKKQHIFLLWTVKLENTDLLI